MKYMMQKLDHFPPLLQVKRGCTAAVIIYILLWKLEKSCQQTLKKERSMNGCTSHYTCLPVKANSELQLPTKVEKIFDIFCKHQRRFSFDFLLFAMTIIAGMNSNCSLDVILMRSDRATLLLAANSTVGRLLCNGLHWAPIRRTNKEILGRKITPK